MELIKDKAYIHSMPEKERELRDVIILEYASNNDVTLYVCDSGIICKGVFNTFNGKYYADDVCQILFTPLEREVKDKQTFELERAYKNVCNTLVCVSNNCCNRKVKTEEEYRKCNEISTANDCIECHERHFIEQARAGSQGEQVKNQEEITFAHVDIDKDSSKFTVKKIFELLFNKPKNLDIIEACPTLVSYIDKKIQYGNNREDCETHLRKNGYIKAIDNVDFMEQFVDRYERKYDSEFGVWENVQKTLDYFLYYYDGDEYEDILIHTEEGDNE